MTTTLHASSLFSKWGFGDGDVIDDVLWRHHDDGVTWSDLVDDKLVLDELIRRHLLPLVHAAMPDSEIDYAYIDSLHNPCRIDSVNGRRVDHAATVLYVPVALDKIEVVVSDEQVMDAARHILRRLR